METAIRDHHIDNIKGVLITLVVFGHLLEPAVQSNPSIRSLYAVIYSFHMPLFIFVSGYLSSAKFTNIKIWNSIVVPYLAIETIYFFFAIALYGKPTSIYFFVPFWILWYMVSLLCWRLLLRQFAHLPRIPFFIAAMIVAVVVGSIDIEGRVLSAFRTATFFPFFLLGYYAKVDNVALLKDPKYVVPAGLLFVCMTLILLLFSFSASIDVKWFYGTGGPLTMGDQFYERMLVRLGLMGWAALIGLCLWIIVPRSKSILTAFGVHSLTIYLFHGFVCKPLALSEITSSMPVSTIVVYALVVMTFLMGLLIQPSVVQVIDRILNPSFLRKAEGV